MITIENREEQLKEHPNFLYIYDPDFKIKEVGNEELWNAPEFKYSIAVDINRFNNGDYMSSDVPNEPIDEED